MLTWLGRSPLRAEDLQRQVSSTFMTVLKNSCVFCTNTLTLSILEVKSLFG